jgi:hypothetical protein
MNLPNTPLIGRPNRSPDVLAEQAHIDTFGMSRTDREAYLAARKRDFFEQEALRGYEDEPKGHTAKQRLDNFVTLRKRTEGEHDALLAQQQRLQDAIDAPAQTKAKRDGLLKTLAKKLLGGEDVAGFDLLRRTAVESEIQDAEARAEIAKLAIAELAEKLEIAALRVRRLKEREREFVQAAVSEHIKAELGPKYRRAIAEFGAIAHQIQGAREAAGLGSPEKIELPTFWIVDDATIRPDRNAVKPWRKLIESWL